MRFANLIMTLISLCTILYGQESPSGIFRFSMDSLAYEPAEVIGYASYYLDHANSMTFEEVQRQSMAGSISIDDLERKDMFLRKPLWIKVVIQPDHPLEQNQAFVVVPNSDLIEFYETNGEQSFHAKGGFLSGKNKGQSDICKRAFPLHILDTKPREIYIKVLAFDYMRITKDFSFLVTSKNEIQLTHHRRYAVKRLELYYYASLLGIFIFTGLFFLFRFLFAENEKFLLWYGLYLVLVGFHLILSQFELIGEFFIFWNNLVYGAFFSFLLNSISFYFFALYLKNILEIDKQHRLHRILTIFIWSLLGAGFIAGIRIIMMYYSVTIFTFSEFQALYLPASLICLYLAIQVIRGKRLTYRFIGTGMLILSLSTVLFAFARIIGLRGHYHIISEMGLLAEIIFLTLAIGQKSKERNAKLLDTEKKLNDELSELVEEKTAHIIKTNKELADQEQLKLSAEFNEKIAHAELKALKAQMNPHFIFNCLNAIRNLVQKNQVESATEYITDFATFIRKVLNYSEIKQITLEEELEICKLYLKMEQLRFEEGFRYQIIIDPGTAIDFIMLPPLLLQPLLENAIWHGLLHKQDDRELTIHISQTDTQVICTIDDNGVGRTYVASLRSSSKSDSVGLRLFMDRLDINNKLMDNQYHYEVIDKYMNNKSAGTKVNLYFEI